MDLPDAEQIEKAYIKDSIEKRFWMGGGSYLVSDPESHR